MPEALSIVKLLIGPFLRAMDWIRRKLKKQEEIHSLCAQVAFALEEYATNCLDVSHDAGTEDCYGDTIIRVQLPTLDFQAIKPDWLLLSSPLRYRMFELPESIKYANGYLANSLDNDSPPDYSEFFRDRQEQYVALGATAGELARDLRRYARLPKSSRAEEALALIRQRQDELRTTHSA